MNKFIITNNHVLLLGDVDLHRDLVPPKYIPENKSIKVLGGGRWYYDGNTSRLYLYGVSTDFGPVTQEVVNKVKKPRKWGHIHLIFNVEVLKEEDLIETYGIEPYIPKCQIQWCESGNAATVAVYERTGAGMFWPFIICQNCATELKISTGDIITDVEEVQVKISALYKGS